MQSGTITMKRPTSNGTASAGVCHIGKVTFGAGSLFHEVDQKNDIGNDAFIEFVVDQASTGCCIATQIKSGASYIRNGRFVLPADEDHFEYWRNHSLPVCGFVYDPASDSARWVDLTGHVNDKPTQFTIEAPPENIFDQAHFPAFREHFLAYRRRFSDAANFGKALADFSHLEDFARCENGIRALFSFHRNRLEAWYFVISTINNFRGHPLLRLLVSTLSHVPGHMDTFWMRGKNTIPEAISNAAELFLKRALTGDTVLTLLGAIDQGGVERGTIGQCVASIVDLAQDRRASLEAIALDVMVPEDVRYWALLLLIIYEQRLHRGYCISVAEKAAPSFTDEDHQERLRGLLETLKTPGLLV
jgi:hypothetical protein